AGTSSCSTISPTCTGSGSCTPADAVAPAAFPLQTGAMPEGTRSRRMSARRRRPRILLVGLTPLLMDVLSGPLSDAADVSAVPFPGDAFEQAADQFGPDMVLV